jgi:hypothetical protein
MLVLARGRRSVAMNRLCLCIALLAACTSKGSSVPFVFTDPHPEAKEIVYVPPPPTDPAAPVIDEIRVAKDVVCDGESNLVRVKAHTKDGDDAYLAYIFPPGLSGGWDRGPALPIVFTGGHGPGSRGGGGRGKGPGRCSLENTKAGIPLRNPGLWFSGV